MMCSYPESLLLPFLLAFLLHVQALDPYNDEGQTSRPPGASGLAQTAVTPSYNDLATLIPPDEMNPVKPKQEQHESRLLHYLLTNYNRQVRPLLDWSGNITVSVGITLTQIFDMDEKNQVMTTNVWLDQEWRDELLTWNPADFGGLQRIRIPCDLIWLPDIVLYNNADDFSGQYMRSLALVNHTGGVFWPPPTKFRSTCLVDVAFFPFDDQTCILKLGSWLHDGFSVDVVNRTATADLTNYTPNGEWTLAESPVLVRRVKKYTCCSEPFPEIVITFHIRRKTLYYMYNIVFPCMMMSTLTVLVFCLPPDSGEKIALGVTVLLAFSVFMLAIAEKMPETSESIPLIGIYLTTVMAITCVSIIMTVIVLSFFYRGPTLTHVPAWAQVHILGKKTPRQPGPQFMKLQKLQNSTYRSGGKNVKTNNCPVPDRARRASTINNLPTGFSSTGANSGIEGTWTSVSEKWPTWQIFRRSNARRKQVSQTENGIIPRSPNNGSTLSEDLLNDHGESALGPPASTVDIRVIPASPNGETLSPLDANLPYADDFHPTNDLDGARGNSRSANAAASTNHRNDLQGNDFLRSNEVNANNSEAPSEIPPYTSAEHEYNRILSEINEKHAEEEEINAILQDWKLLAQKVDYILFWVFLCLTTVSSCIFIFILPYFKRGKLL